MKVCVCAEKEGKDDSDAEVPEGGVGGKRGGVYSGKLELF